ncbi:hypothetical protein [Leifsonia sp. A12D58]|uniref:hypothetical protein n=1 Tax=Leifsonia sp. A12D58 TaxID=3397674 RepID=UPI0039DF4748
MKRHLRWRNGRLYQDQITARETAQLLQNRQSELGWNAAGALRASLLRREVPPTVQMWDVVPEPGEVFFFDVPVEYERYYGQDVAYNSGGGFFIGPPAFVVAGLAVNSMANAARRRNAEAAARSQWREWQQVRLLVTNHRLICLANGQWMSFHYSAMTAVYPEVREWALVCEFGVMSPPLRIRGTNAPIAAVMTVFGTRGLEAVAQHPSLQSLGA